MENKTCLKPPTSVFTHSNTKLDLPGAHSATMIFPHRHCPVARTARGRGGKVPSASWSRWVECKMHIQYILLVSSPPQNLEMSFSMHIYIHIHNICVCLLNLLTIEHIKTKPLDYYHYLYLSFWLAPSKIIPCWVRQEWPWKWCTRHGEGQALSPRSSENCLSYVRTRSKQPLL